MNQPLPAPQPAASAWRFSLRELLLLMVAVAAVLGWGRAVYLRYMPFQASRFSQYFVTQLRTDFRDVAVQLGEPQTEYASSGGSGSGGINAVHRQIFIDIQLSPGRDVPYVDALLEHVSQRITESGCVLSGASGIVTNVASIDSTARVIHEIHRQYQRPNLIGALNINVLRLDQQSVRVWAVLDEQKAR